MSLSAQAGSTLRHTSVPPDLAEDTGTGWAGFLDTLKAEAASA